MTLRVSVGLQAESDSKRRHEMRGKRFFIENQTKSIGLIYCILSTDYFFDQEIFYLPTNFTNLHEFIALRNNGDLYGRTNFH